MYSINRDSDGIQHHVESFDSCIELLDFFYGNRYEIKKDAEMANVWWVKVDSKQTFMVTSMAKVFDVREEN